MKQIFRDWKKAVPFILCAAVILISVFMVLFGHEYHREIIVSFDGSVVENDYCYYYRENVWFIISCIILPVGAAVLMMVQIASEHEDRKSRALMAAFCFFMAAAQLFFGDFRSDGYTGLMICIVLFSVLGIALLAMSVFVLTGKAKKWMYTVVSVAGMGIIVFTVLVHCMNMRRLGIDYQFFAAYLASYFSFSTVAIPQYINMFLLYVVILMCEDGKVTGRRETLPSA